MTWQLASPNVSQLRQSETGTQDGSQCLYNPVMTSVLPYLLELIQNVQPTLKVRGLSKSMNIKRMGLVGAISEAAYHKHIQKSTRILIFMNHHYMDTTV